MKLPILPVNELPEDILLGNEPEPDETKSDVMKSAVSAIKRPPIKIKARIEKSVGTILSLIAWPQCPA